MRLPEQPLTNIGVSEIRRHYRQTGQGAPVVARISKRLWPKHSQSLQADPKICAITAAMPGRTGG
jgi:hypothetical protein